MTGSTLLTKAWSSAAGLCSGVKERKIPHTSELNSLQIRSIADIANPDDPG